MSALPPAVRRPILDTSRRRPSSPAPEVHDCCFFDWDASCVDEVAEHCSTTCP